LFQPNQLLQVLQPVAEASSKPATTKAMSDFICLLLANEF
jgi:hypothetical protein